MTRADDTSDLKIKTIEVQRTYFCFNKQNMAIEWNLGDSGS